MHAPLRRAGLAAATLLLMLATTGCGQMTIRTWINVDEANSTGFVQLNPPDGDPFPLTGIQGGFLATVKLDTTQLLSSPWTGSITIDKVRLTARSGALGRICVWGNPAGTSDGTLALDLNAGTGTADLNLDLLAATPLNANAPVGLQQAVTFNLSGFTLDSLLAAAVSGATDGLFATEAPFEGESDILGTPVLFDLDVSVTNGAKPPVFASTALPFCGPRFDQQGRELFHAINSRGSYLQAQSGDDPLQPLVISLADIGAAPGATLRLQRVGTYSDDTILKDGNATSLTGIFSSTPDIGPASDRTRVPGAIDAGPDVKTGYIKCLFLFCWFQSTDVPQDFRIDPTNGLDVVVPAGAAYLIVAPLPSSYKWDDDSGFGFGVNVTVNP